MFDIGGWEFLAIVILAIVIIGPKDLPAAVRAVSLWARKARALAGDFRSGLDDLAREVELDQVGNQIRDGLGVADLGEAANSIRKEIENTIDPEGEISGAFDQADGIEDDPEDDFEDDPGGDDEEDGETARIASDETDEDSDSASASDEPVAKNHGKADS